ncbi:MAG: phosphoenolpyruvate synthase [Parasphingorhabdus sp.]|uniref:phosphoenolpyruvate synthase n=1 Tax=Parasphingorhabdus sp. TaxID=2709688 RepID=UPI003001DD81
MTMSMLHEKYIRWLKDTSLDDLQQVGGKNASLGELANALSGHIHVPESFSVTAQAYRDLLSHNEIWPRMDQILSKTDWTDIKLAASMAARLRDMVEKASLPEGLEEGIRSAYQSLCKEHGLNTSVAVRSSATAEDLPDASFAGQHETYLNIRGADDLFEAVSKCFASLFTQRAILYRINKGFDHKDVALSVGVQRMIRADKASSGVIFTLDTESGNRDVVTIAAVWGLGEAIVQGVADPDEYIVHKLTLKQGFEQVISHRIGGKKVKLIYACSDAVEPTLWRSVSRKDQSRLCLSDAEIIKLAKQAITVEEHYSKLHGKPMPMDIEWAKDGQDGQLYILQARPETIYASSDANLLTQYHLDGEAKVIAEGQAVGDRIGAGPVRIVGNSAELENVQSGDIMVAEATTPDWEPAMKRAAAIITEHGGRTCHAAIVARELGVPVIVGVAGVRGLLMTGQEVTVDCSQGMTGRVLDGRVPFSIDTIDIGKISSPDVDIMVNMANPGAAFKTAALPVAGVGLARTEFIIANEIKAHPMALLFPDRISKRKTRKKIDKLTAGYSDGVDYFVTRLAEGIAMIAAAFYPRPVIVRTSDFKSNEYASLLGGSDFEDAENNPMIGFRGASRYVHPAYQEAFGLECQALRRVRDDMGLSNVIVMIPFCRRIEEAEQVIATMAENGLKQGKGGLQLYIMCEIPSNVILIDEFAKLFDGFSIGSNDLTQLVLGVDRDSEILAADFDEQDPAVTMMIEKAIAGAHRNGLKCGICGQAPSDRPGFADWLVEKHIDSISLSPDSVVAVLQRLSNPKGIVNQESKQRGKQITDNRSSA